MSRGNVLLEAESFEAVNEEEVTKETKEKSQTENGVYVKGMALPFGTPSRNGVQYEKESVKEAHEDLVGRTMLFNHKQDWVTGHILNTEITEDGMYFEGDINPNAEMPNGVPVAEAIERGDINSVSIQAFIEQLGEEADEEAVIQDMETEKVAVKDFLEISAVSIPGFPQAEALPEHLQSQGVQPVTEMLGTENLQKSTESLENPEYEVGDFVEWEFGDGESQGEIIERETEPGESMSAGGNEFTVDEEDDEPLYKIEEWDETSGDNGEFTNNVVKFEEALSSTDRPEAAEQKKGEPFAGYDSFEDCVQDNQDKSDPEAYCGEIKDRAEEMEEQLAKEQFEFSPVPSHVLYESEEDARRRAENLGLESIHEHEMSGQIYYMAGENHEAWMNAIERENPLDRESTVTEQTFDDYPEAAQENARMALEAKEDTGDPNDCGTRVGWERANQLDNGEPLSEDTIGRMAAFSRHEDNKEQGEEGRADCGWMMWKAWGGDEGIEWAENKMDEIDEENLSDETKQMLEEADIMSNTESEENDSAESGKNQEQVTQEAFVNFVAEHMEGLDASDVSDAVGDSNFTGLDQGEVAKLLAMEFELDTDTVMDVIGDLEDMEAEGSYGNDDEDDDDEMDETEEDADEDKSRSELKDRIEELEERLEKLVTEDDGKSKQPSPGAEESSVERKPNFKDAL
jgi:phage head maturation protease